MFRNKIDYCLNCVTKPCVKGCPLKNDIPLFINYSKEGDFLKAFSVLSETNVLPFICGSICPSLKLCENNCVRKLKGKSVEIGLLESIIGEQGLKKNYPLFEKKNDFNGKNVAVVGGGPAGLSCAAFLKKLGYGVTIYEKHNYLGGLISHGIPDFRLDSDLREKSFEKIINLGIEVKYNHELGKNIFLKNLKKKYDAVFLGFGANVSKILHIKGKNLKNVYGSNEFLESRVRLNLREKNVIVVGGGDTAIDMARVAKRFGGNVLIIYRGNEKEMKALKSVVSLAKKEEISFMFNTNIKQIISNENDYNAYLCNDKGYNYIYPCDYVFFAIGSKPDEINKKLGLKLDLNGYIKVDKRNMTSMRGVFAGGNVINEKNTVAHALASGRNSAYNIDLYLKNIDNKKH